MFVGLLNNKAADEQGYDVGYGYNEKKPYVFKLWHIAVVLLILFPYICIFALFGMVANIHKETLNNVS